MSHQYTRSKLMCLDYIDYVPIFLACAKVGFFFGGWRAEQLRVRCEKIERVSVIYEAH